jgi:transcriptional regulator with XRE-family HTH domain
MTGGELRDARKERDWTQADLAGRLGVSQGYVCLLERDQRPVPGRLGQRLASLLNLSASRRPLSSSTSPLEADAATRALGTLGYPGFAHYRQRQTLNPAELLLRALRTPELDARVVEALVWVVLTYPDLDWAWLTREAKVNDLQNRLGFLVTLARQLAERTERIEAAERLAVREEVLAFSRLQREDAFRPSMTEAERRWLRQHRPSEAAQWNLLTNLVAADLNHAVEAPSAS